MILETVKHARQRGAEILALLKGFGMTCDAHNIAIPEPDGTSASMAIQNAIRDAKLNIDDIDYINAHGTSTKVNDRVETNAIKKAFGEHAGRVQVIHQVDERPPPWELPVLLKRRRLFSLSTMESCRLTSIMKREILNAI